MKKKNDSKTGFITTDAIYNKLSVDSRVIVKDDKKAERANRKNGSLSKMAAIVDRITQSVNDNKAMMELLPDLKLVKSILVSSILSPKDLSSVRLSIGVDAAKWEEEVDGDLVRHIENHFKSKYNLETKMKDIIGDALFEYGSYCLMVLPESTIVNLVNAGKVASNESYNSVVARNANLFKPLNILNGSGADMTKLEGLGIEISDNLNHLLVSSIRRSHIAKSVWSKLGMERFKEEPEVTLGYGHMASLGRSDNPLVMKIPSDAVVPVHTPGDVSDHVGYFVILDENGVPVTATRDSNSMAALKDSINKAANGSALGGLIISTGFSIGGGANNPNKINPVELMDRYIDAVEQELESQLKKGEYGTFVKVSKPRSMYYIMLTRALSQKCTRLIYVPKEIVTYFAYFYDEYGMGKSLLEDTKVFGSLRAILLFAEIMAGVKSSVGRTRLDITLDTDDPDPSATVEAIVHHFSGLQTEALPMGRLVAGDIVRALQKAAVDVNIDGGEAFPGTKTEVSDVSRDHRRPDSDLSERLKRMQYSGLGVPPEIVDSAMEGELATVVVSRNQLYAKQVMEYAATTEAMLSDFVRIYTRCSGSLIKEINKTIKEEDLYKFVMSLTVSLPEPDLAGIRSQAEAFGEYSEAIDAVVTTYITEDMMSEWLDGDVSSATLTSLRISVSSMLKREWLGQQGIFSEIATRLADGDISNRIIDYNRETLNTLKDVLVKLAKEESKLNKKLAETKEGLEEPEEEEESTDEDGGEEGADTGDAVDDGSGGDDMGDDAGGDDAPAEDDAGGDDEFM